MPSDNKFSWDPSIALIGPAMMPIEIGTGSATGGISFPTGATSDFTREILIGGTSDGNIHCVFKGQGTTSTGVTIPVLAGQRYQWGLIKVYSSGTTVDNIWAFY